MTAESPRGQYYNRLHPYHAPLDPMGHVEAGKIPPVVDSPVFEEEEVTSYIQPGSDGKAGIAAVFTYDRLVSHNQPLNPLDPPVEEEEIGASQEAILTRMKMKYHPSRITLLQRADRDDDEEESDSVHKKENTQNPAAASTLPAWAVQAKDYVSALYASWVSPVVNQTVSFITGKKPKKEVVAPRAPSTPKEIENAAYPMGRPVPEPPRQQFYDDEQSWDYFARQLQQADDREADQLEQEEEATIHLFPNETLVLKKPNSSEVFLTKNNGTEVVAKKLTPPLSSKEAAKDINEAKLIYGLVEAFQTAQETRRLDEMEAKTQMDELSRRNLEIQKKYFDIKDQIARRQKARKTLGWVQGAAGVGAAAGGVIAVATGGVGAVIGGIISGILGFLTGGLQALQAGLKYKNQKSEAQAFDLKNQREDIRSQMKDEVGNMNAAMTAVMGYFDLMIQCAKNASRAGKYNGSSDVGY